MKITAIVLTLNNYPLLKQSLRSLLANNYKKLSMLVWDNGSTEDLANKIVQDFPTVEVLRSPTNLGFAQGNNKAITYALKKHNPDYFLLFNNDAVAKRNLLDSCLPYLRQNVDLLSPTILLSKARGIDNVGIDYFRSGYAHGRLEPHNPANLVSGCCLFVSREFVQKNFKLFGWLFNPLFFSYAEDLDLGLRAKLLGAKSTVLDSALVVHERLGTLGEANVFRHYISWRNLLWIVITTWPVKTIIKNFTFLVEGQLIIQALYLWDGKFWLFLKIYLSTLKHVPELLAIRRKIMIAVRYPEALEEVFAGNIARWSSLLAGRKLYHMGHALRLTYDRIFA